ncbi:MAG: FtsX-like permease family protein [Planctomycetes bacterium]|nr:FtsX-like permease family protein [Planctomycetota bacterium]
MLAPKFIPLVIKHIVRHPTRSLLTVAGVAVAMFLFCTVQSMQEGVEAATRVTATDTTLVVYRENRYCPFSSRLPEYYGRRIESIPGVTSVVPIRIHVSNCRASLDVVTFRGVPSQPFVDHHVPNLEIVAGSVADWERRSDAALVGESLAKRRGVRVGDRFSAAGLTVYVAGIVRSDEPQDRNVAYTHLPFIQEASRRGGSGGVVTQFNVKVDDPARLEPVALAIDEAFAHDPDPTSTRPEKAFVARAASDVLELVSFASWLGWGALAAVFALVANAIVLAVQERARDHAVLQTLGFTGALVGRLVIVEGALMGVLGGTAGAIAAFLVVHRGRFSLTMEGLNVEITADPTIIVIGLLMSVALGVGAGLVPAWQVSRREIAASFRAV